MYENYKGRIEEILSKLTLREKIGQLNQEVTPTLENLEALKEAIRRGEVGSIIMANTATAGNDAQNKINSDFYNEIQRIAVEESPNGIPLIYGRDVIHGHRTCFPIPLAQAAAFNSELVEKSYSDIAEEATAESVHWTFTPMLDISRDPRWGRIIEGPGEDPYVGQCVAKAVVKGLQGDDVSKEEKMLACAKHFIGYGASEGGRDYHRTEISNYSLFNYYLPAFRAAVEAGALTVMSSFNDINGQPVTTSEFYLKEVLRDMLGFEGFVVSDWESIKQLIRQGVAENDADCARLSIKAGLDMDMVDRIYITELEKLAANDPDIIEKIDESVRRILYVKLKKGLFERPYCSQKPYDKEKHMNNALNIARESIVLLKNEKNVLPLKKEANIALVGPFVDEKRSLLGARFDDETGLMHIYYGNCPVCAQNSQGILRYEQEWHKDQEIHDKYGEIEDEMIVIREYVKLYERSPQMPFPSIKDYRMFGEMGDVVFGAKYSDNFGFTFSSWYQDREHLSVTLGNYSGDYESSKEAFATRARLVDIHKLFTEDEAANLYRCIDYVRVHSEDLTFEQDEQLRDLTDKLTDGYPKLRDNPPSFDEDTTIKMDM